VGIVEGMELVMVRLRGMRQYRRGDGKGEGVEQ
jgi:hypothetical protein